MSDTEQPRSDDYVPRFRYQEVGGVQWCPIHQGVADDLDSYVDQCDMYDESAGDKPCEIVPLFIREAM